MKNKCQLCNLSFGDMFVTKELGKFMVLEKREYYILVCSVGGIGVKMKYNSALISSYGKSDINKYCNDKLLPKFENEFGKKNIVEHFFTYKNITASNVVIKESDLFKIRLIDFGEYGNYYEKTKNNLNSDIWINYTDHHMKSWYKSKYGEEKEAKVNCNKDIMVVCSLSGSTIVEKCN